MCTNIDISRIKNFTALSRIFLLFILSVKNTVTIGIVSVAALIYLIHAKASAVVPTIAFTMLVQMSTQKKGQIMT